MNSIILTAAVRYMMPLMILTSIYLLVHGHHSPGGGFTGGLVAASAFALLSIARGAEETRRALGVDPRRLAAFGLLASVGSGLVGFLAGDPFLTGHWLPFALPGIGKLGTPVVFDTGVYMVVVGVTMTFILELETEDEG